MPSKKSSIPPALDRYLANSSDEIAPSLSKYVEDGSAHITLAAIDALHSRLPVIRQKVAAVPPESRLATRLHLLLRHFEETAITPTAPDATRRDVAFALFYFLKGYDRIPDSIPEIGLLDDALVVDHVLSRHRLALQAHWKRQRRPWPEGG